MSKSILETVTLNAFYVGEGCWWNMHVGEDLYVAGKPLWVKKFHYYLDLDSS